MDAYVGRILGDLPSTCNKPPNYFLDRFCFVDCRGPLIVHENAYLGIGVKIVTTGHDLSNWPAFGPMILKGVSIGDGAWVASFAVLHNCVIEAHAIVAMGAVVNGLTVPEYGVAAGNPAKVVGFMFKGVIVPREIWEREFGVYPDDLTSKVV